MEPDATNRSSELARRLRGVEAAHTKQSAPESTREWARITDLLRQLGLVSDDAPSVRRPEVSSEHRRYLPLAYLEPGTIISNKVYGAVDPTGLVFAIGSSSMFWAWMKTVGGRLESRPSFSSTITWNNFPLPPLSTTQKEA